MIEEVEMAYWDPITAHAGAQLLLSAGSSRGLSTSHSFPLFPVKPVMKIQKLEYMSMLELLLENVLIVDGSSRSFILCNS